MSPALLYFLKIALAVLVLLCFYTHFRIVFPRSVRKKSLDFLVKAMVFPVVTYGCESWSVKKAEC